MGHPIPGLGYDKVTRNQTHLRTVSAPPNISNLRRMIKPLNAEYFADIKNNARNDWKNELTHNNSSVTTYSGLHSAKLLDQPTQMRVRPSSPTRLNKPHPEQLKKVKGCYEPNKAKARLENEDSARERLNGYIKANKSSIDLATGKQNVPMRPRPRTAHCTSNVTREKVRTVMGDVPAQAVEAWMKLSNDKGKSDLMKSVDDEIRVKHPKYVRRQDYTFDRRRQYPSLRKELEAPRKIVEPVLSTTRWMKKAGQEESLIVQKLLESLRQAPNRVLPTKGPHFHITDYSSMFTTAPKPPYYDFQIHPEWHQPWHKQYVKPVTS